MKFGLFYLPTYLPQVRDAATAFDNITEQVLFADEIGLDYCWMVEHHFVRHGGLCAASFSLLSYLAGRTKRIRLGVGASVLPINDPVRVAEFGATLDQVSRGRFDLGIGRGFVRHEFEAFGVDMKDSRERLEEGIEVIKAAWTQPTVNMTPRFRARLEDLPILPPPRQKPHPPIWVACFLTQESFEWTAKEGYNLMYVAYHVDPAVAKERIAWYLDALPKHGRNAKDHEVMCCYHAHFTPTEELSTLRALVEQPMAEYGAAGAEAMKKPPDPVAYKAYSARADYLKQQSATGFDLWFPGRVLMGGPRRALDRLKEMRDSGITQVSMIVDFGSLAQKDIMRSLRIFADEILPKAREL